MSESFDFKKQKVAIGTDHAGFELKQELVAMLDKLGIEYYDFGVYEKSPSDYPSIAKEVALAVADGEFDKGIILCGSGLGVCITANKVVGIRAVTCHDTYSARVSRTHNDANILTMGARVIGVDLAKEVALTWLKTGFEGGRHQVRVSMIEQ
ncbi:MAG: ribose 5-phosphate isomerase B [Candidatus Gastranaerophilales bacterium]|nr:ribose 5-phosphate isomerase B [Candidatus Gastranaerophilales bacterium]